MFLFFLSLVVSVQNVSGQAAFSDSVVVKDVFVFGNAKTRERIIIRELPFEKGDRIGKSDMDSIINRCEENIFNLHLFLKVDITTKTSALDEVTFIIVVKERWYFFPIPVVEFADRGVNQWFKQHNAELDRFEYGVQLIKQNFRGRNETLRLLTQFGYSQKYELDYRIPYINRDQTIGLDLYLYHSRNKEFAYATGLDNVLDFYESNQVSRQELKSFIRFKYRKKIYTGHSFDIGYDYVKTEDSVIALNPYFLNTGRSDLKMMSLRYRFRYNSTDIHFYPEKGNFLDFLIRKQGIGVFNDMDQWQCSLTGAKYVELGRNLFAAGSFNYYYATDQKQSYYFSPVIGYGEFFTRGYEYYVIRGQQYVLNRNEIKWKLHDEVYYVPLLKRSPKVNNIPIKLYLKGLFDVSYVYDRETFKDHNLTNKLLYGFGIGLDLVSYYDIVFRTELTTNHKGETGLYFHIEKAILGLYE